MTDSAEKMPDEIYIGICDDWYICYENPEGMPSTKYIKDPTRVTGDEVGEQSAVFGKVDEGLNANRHWKDVFDIAKEKCPEVLGSMHCLKAAMNCAIRWAFENANGEKFSYGGKFYPMSQAETMLAERDRLIQASRPTHDSETPHPEECLCMLCSPLPMKAPPPEDDRQRALERMVTIDTFDWSKSKGQDTASFNSLCRDLYIYHGDTIRQCLTAPQPHVGVEVTDAHVWEYKQNGQEVGRYCTICGAHDDIEASPMPCFSKSQMFSEIVSLREELKSFSTAVKYGVDADRLGTLIMNDDHNEDFQPRQIQGIVNYLARKFPNGLKITAQKKGDEK